MDVIVILILQIKKLKQEVISCVIFLYYQSKMSRFQNFPHKQQVIAAVVIT
jgi:hypothetical protein